jgi:hypothetical protein
MSDAILKISWREENRWEGLRGCGWGSVTVPYSVSFAIATYPPKDGVSFLVLMYKFLCSVQYHFN